MTDHVTRLYLAAGSLLGLFVAWAGIAAHPWSTPPTSTDPAAQALARYEQRLQQDAAVVRRLRADQGARASVPLVRVVTLPPLTTTRTS
jgi:hypothetical protein